MAPASGGKAVRDPTEIRTWVKRDEVPQITFTVNSEPGKLSVLSGTLWNLNLTLSNPRDVTYAISGEFLVYVQAKDASDWGGTGVLQGMLVDSEKPADAKQRLGCGSFIHVDESNRMQALVTGSQTFVLDHKPAAPLSWSTTLHGQSSAQLKTQVFEPWLPDSRDGIWVATPQLRPDREEERTFRYWIPLPSLPTSTQSEAITQAELVPIDERSLLDIAQSAERPMVLRRVALAWLADCAPISSGKELSRIASSPSVPVFVRREAPRALVWSRAPNAEHELRRLLLESSPELPEHVLLYSVYALKDINSTDAKSVLSEVAESGLPPKVRKSAAEAIEM